jgi:hypothetical protein
MASVPKGSCGLCKIVKDRADKINSNIKKHILIYSFVYLLFAEIGSLLIRDLPDYAIKWYPVLTQLTLSIIFYTLWLYRFNLKFCQRKNLIVKSLSAYYLFGTICVLFQFCESFFIKVITYGLLLVVFVTLLLTIYQPKKEY